MIWNDAANKIGISVSERCHQLGERFFVQLANSTKHALLGLVRRAKSCLCYSSDLIQTHNTIHWEGQEKIIKWILIFVRYKDGQKEEQQCSSRSFAEQMTEDAISRQGSQQVLGMLCRSSGTKSHKLIQQNSVALVRTD